MDPASPAPRLFQTGLLAARRDRGARMGFANGADFVHRAVAEEIALRLSEVARQFEAAALIGSGGRLQADAIRQATGHVPASVLELAPSRAEALGIEPVQTLDPLALAPGAHDLIVSALELHWQNDPVGQLIQMRRALRPDGLMLAALFGGETLIELRTALAEAEVAVSGGLSPRIAPMADVATLGALLQRAGFAMPVADRMVLTASYPDAAALMRDLRAMGETNILSDRRRVPMRRAMLAACEEIYAARYADADGRVRATFEIVMLTGWAPGPEQPQPKRPGSAKARLADALGVPEISAGEATGRPNSDAARDD